MAQVIDFVAYQQRRFQMLAQARRLLLIGALSPDEFQLVKEYYTPGRSARQKARMGSVKRQLKKKTAKHLKLVKANESKPTGLLDPKNGLVSPDAFAGWADTTVVTEPIKPSTTDEGTVIGSEYWAKLLEENPRGCPSCREDYELEHVTCCPRCHKRGEFSEIEDKHGRFQVCCTIRQALCPSETHEHC